MPASQSAHRALALSLLAGTALAAPGAALAADQPQATIEEIVVTATRREGTLREAPVAVSAMTGDQLAARQITGVAGLTSMVPNLQFGASYTEARITVRGIGTNNVNGGSDPGVAYHLDGVYIGATGPASDSFFDVERVEVLRGPQGTLFGQNATGGSVNLIPKRPSPDPGGSLGLTLGADPFQYAVEAVINGPLSGDGALSGRLSLHRSYNEGYLKNLAANGPDRLNDDDSFGVRGQLLFEPSDGVSLHAAINYRRGDANGAGTQLLGRGGRFPAPTTAEALGGVAPPLDRPEVYANIGHAKGEFLLGAVDASFDLGPGVLKVLVSAGRTTSDVGLDGDGTAVDFTTSLVRYTAKQAFGEAIYDLNAVPNLDVIFGINAYYQELDQVFDVPVSFIFGPQPVVVSLGGELQTSTYAAFVHGDYRLNERVKLFGGARYTYSRKAYAETNNFVGSASGRPNWDRLTYEVGISAEVLPGVNAYLKHATGFKGGGLQLGTISAPVNPETNESTEAGLKGLFFERTLEANLAVFHMRYNDLQLTRVAGYATGFQNAAEARIDGAELEAVWRPTAALRLEFNGALLNTKFERFDSADPAEPSPVVQNLAGRRLPNAPRSSASLGAYYTHEVGDIGALTFGARYYWQDKYFLTEFNLPHVAQRAVGRLDLTADFVSADGVWRASAFARNLTDELVRGSGIVVSNLLGSPALATLEPGRTVGVSLRRAF